MGMLSLPPLPLSKFLWNKKDGSLVAEMSDFGPARDGRWWLKPLYDDACDLGIAIYSEQTGRTERFYLLKEECRDGDLLALHFAPENQRCPVRLVTIFND